MTMTKHSEQLPRPAAELERLAEYYDTHDTSTEMDNGDWVEPQPMATTSLRLPADVIDQLKQQARTRHVRYTTYVRSILERAARGGSPPELAEITERLDRIERALSGGHPDDDQKTALRTSVRAGTALLVSVVVIGVVEGTDEPVGTKMTVGGEEVRRLVPAIVRDPDEDH